MSDSRSALETVAQLDSLHPLTKRVKENVKKGKEVKLFWMKAHAETEGNERADQLAKDCRVTLIKSQLRSRTIDEWTRSYVESTTASITRILFPDAALAYRVLRRVELDTVLVQMFTGHGEFSEYLHRFKLEESPSCICDPAVDQTVLQVIACCPMFGREPFECDAKPGKEISAGSIASLISKDYVYY